MIISYWIYDENIQETNALASLIVLNKDFDAFIADKLEMLCTLVGYWRKCEGKCMWLENIYNFYEFTKVFT